MTDLFADFYTDKQIDQIFKVMALTPEHTYQVLTKRARRMFEYVTGLYRRRGELIDHATHDGAQLLISAFERGFHNVWLGVSVENQKAADERLPYLCKTPAAVRWVSAEPLLGAVDLTRYLDNVGRSEETGEVYRAHDFEETIGWVVVGGESGKAARPMHPDWARSLRDQCGAAGVSFFFKQWGEYRPARQGDDPMSLHTFIGESGGTGREATRDNMKAMLRVGKKEAGRRLDGRTWDEMPA